MFGKVFTFLASRYDKRYEECFDDHSDHGEAEGDRVWKYPGYLETLFICIVIIASKTSINFWFIYILNSGYRLICRKWNKAVQHFYQNHQSHLRTLTDIADEEWPRQGRCRGYNNWEYSSENFLRFFEETRRAEKCGSKNSPIFQRALRVDVRSSDMGVGANRVIERFLQAYGKDIWFLDLENTNTSETLVEFYFALKDLLILLPNLKVLHLWYIQSRRHSWREKRKLRRIVKLCPLDKFPNLIFLEILQNLPAPILNELLVRNTHV